MDRKPRLLDLFCGAGGAAMGYSQAGFEVVGVDIKLQPNYPFAFIQDDALGYLNDWSATLFDAIHASPPCQLHSLASQHQGRERAAEHPELIAPTRELLEQADLPWVIENVAGAPIRHDVSLCGEMFGLRVHRHRYFEISGFHVMQAPHSMHNLKGAEHNCDLRDGHARQVAGNYADHEDAGDAMGIDWMGRRELSQAIPPAYTEHIGSYLLSEIKMRAAA